MSDILFNGARDPSLAGFTTTAAESLLPLLNDAHAKGADTQKASENRIIDNLHVSLQQMAGQTADIAARRWVTNDIAATWPEGSLVVSCWVIDSKLDVKSTVASVYHRPDWCDRKHKLYDKHTEDRRYMLLSLPS